MVNIGGDCKLRLIEKKDNETSFRSHGKNVKGPSKLHDDRQPGQKSSQNRRLNSTIIHHLKTWAYVNMR